MPPYDRVMSDAPRYVGVPELAKRLGITEPDAVMLLRTCGLKGVVRVGTGDLRIPEALIEDLRASL